MLYRELRGFQYQDVAQYLRALPGLAVATAVVLTALNYALLTAYDVFGLRYAGQRLPYRRVAMASLIAYSFSIAFGHAYITGGGVRYRLYTGWGLSGTDVARIIVFAGGAFWVGYALLGGVTFLAGPLALPDDVNLPVPLRGAGFLLLAAFLGYLALSVYRKEPLRLGPWQLEVPSLRLAGAQGVIAALDMMLSALILYVLLPAGSTGYTVVLSVYLLAVMAGVLSQVPGGLGVFDTVVLLVLGREVGQLPVLGALLVYRAVYYVLPAVLAALALGVSELMRYRERLQEAAQTVRAGTTRWLPLVVPQALAVLTFIGGVVLLVSGVLPSEPGRLRWLVGLVPLPVVEASHFAGSLIGAGLLFLAWGIRFRVDAAYLLTIGALGVGILVSVLRGGGPAQVLTLSLLLVALVPCRRHFHRRSSLLSQPYTPAFLATVGAVLAVTLWLGLFAYRYVDYSSQLWWRFTLDADAPRFLRTLVAGGVVVAVVALVRLVRPAPPEGELPSEEDLDRVAAILAERPGAEANLAFLGDKHLLFNEDHSAFIMYAVQGRSFIAMGDPVGPREAWEDLAWRFRTMADHHGAHTVFYQVTEEALALYLDLGLALYKLGEEGRVDLQAFSLEGQAKKDQRQSLRKMEKVGAEFEILSPDEARSVMPDLRRISDTWLEEKNTREKGFSLGFFDERYLLRTPLAVVRQEGEIKAFANLWVSGHKDELSADLMRYRADAPPGVMEFLFTKVMLWGQSEGYRWFSIGMAPFSGMETRALAPLWHRLGAMLYRHGEHFYNFQGLRQYKEKFGPVWEPRFLAAPDGLALLTVLRDVAALISGGLRGMVGK